MSLVYTKPVSSTGILADVFKPDTSTEIVKVHVSQGICAIDIVVNLVGFYEIDRVVRGNAKVHLLRCIIIICISIRLFVIFRIQATHARAMTGPLNGAIEALKGNRIGVWIKVRMVNNLVWEQEATTSFIPVLMADSTALMSLKGFSTAFNLR
ncbi:hypothetical protein DFJ58DRAFT_850386 [Suillus subalutaceus]|uniref:uncharacterized protein n=1 Tax=Suillus subalutaceus TaxID=48586 RepID=UPI001B873B99|nr:uncharacterized protein DFJ58DRAFT_850386 [Suillus subalutaceus]KAG1816969.1 hypothetical protein DFJ58DRAFT_850386 [Suillus subalutaceus]